MGTSRTRKDLLDARTRGSPGSTLSVLAVRQVQQLQLYLQVRTDAVANKILVDILLSKSTLPHDARSIQFGFGILFAYPAEAEDAAHPQ